MKNTTILLLIAVILIAGGAFVFGKSNGATGNDALDDSGNSGSGEIQKIIISERDLNYYPNTITVKAGQPVSISLDNSVTGCLRSFTIRDFGLSKYLRTPQETLDFTPTQKGTFNFACSMGMGFGKLVVE
mgnify:FL=1